MNPVRGFVTGLRAPLQAGFLIRRHGLMRFALLPVVLNIVLAVAAFVLAIGYVRGERDLVALADRAPALSWLLLIVLAGLAAMVLFLLAQTLLSGPLCDVLAGRLERALGQPVEDPGLWTGLAVSLAHGVLKLMLYVAGLVLALLLSAAAGPAGPVAGFAFGLAFVAYDGFDFPLGRRGRSFGAKWAYLVRHPGLSLGYSLAMAGVYLLPGALVLAPPLGAAGATWAYLRLEGAAPAPGASPSARAGAGPAASNPGPGGATPPYP